MVTSIPPADPCGPACGTGEADEVAGGPDADVDCPEVDVGELAGVLEPVVVPEFEQLTSAATVAAPTNVARRLKAMFMTPSAVIGACDAAQASSVGQPDPVDTGGGRILDTSRWR
jgi:hypothetical protein